MMRRFWEYFFREEEDEKLQFCGMCKSPIIGGGGEVLYDALDEGGNPQRYTMYVCSVCGDHLDEMSQK